MAKIRSLRADRLPLLGLFWLGVAAFAVGLMLPAKAERQFLDRDADRLKIELKNFVDGQFQEALAAVDPGKPAAVDYGDWMRNFEEWSRILRREYYSAAGKLLSREGDTKRLLAMPADAKHTIQNGNSRIGAQRWIAAGPGRTGGGYPHAVVALPIVDRGAYRGAIVFYLDQTKQLAMLRDTNIGLGSMILALIGFCASSTFLYAWWREQQQRRAEERARFLQFHDALTELPNRIAFEERLEDVLTRRRRDGSQVAVLRVDIDRFKHVNDVVGNQGGDALLRMFVARLMPVMREVDIAARLSGDEFAIALTGLSDPADALLFMDRLIAATEAPYHVAGHELRCSMSAGISFAPHDGDECEALLKHADLALARAKRDGGNRTNCFEQGMDHVLQRRRLLEHELRGGLARDEFEVVYQPQYDLNEGTCTGYEALVRWNHPVHGRIAPSHFISVAEEVGVIIPLGEFVLRSACAEAASWPAPLNIAVNLSPAQFRNGGMALLVASVLETTGLAPERLELEITESLLINDTEAVLEELNRLRHLGVGIAMDDFGTGYSSLSYLARFPFSKIKIDRSFVRAMTRDDTVAAIVSTIVALGRSLGVTITAEGVETEEQAKHLTALGCAQAQGFLFGYPAAIASDMSAPAMSPARLAASA